MKGYREMTKEELLKVREELNERYEKCKALNLTLDMTRGKPSPVQLDLSNDIYDTLKDGFKTAKNEDTRNYGIAPGIEEIRKIFADLLGTDKDNIFMGNSSSLNQMYDAIMRSMVFGEIDSPKPWSQVEGKKWLCPAPGYDRHFRVTETMGFELIAVPMTENGPDMDVVEELVKDDKVKGIWCVPCYSNPDGVVDSRKWRQQHLTSESSGTMHMYAITSLRTEAHGASSLICFPSARATATQTEFMSSLHLRRSLSQAAVFPALQQIRTT